ncbi:MAG: hypothetical protein MJ175_08015, partial [Clostridia bacterium]|nr:hypothetical protein [Clostridia bacterium]
MNQPVLLWIWLSLVCGPDSDVPVRLLGAMHSIDAIFEAAREDYASLGFLKDSVITALCDKSLDRPRRITEVCAQKNIGILPYDSMLYPERLRRI